MIGLALLVGSIGHVSEVVGDLLPDDPGRLEPGNRGTDGLIGGMTISGICSMAGAARIWSKLASGSTHSRAGYSAIDASMSPPSSGFWITHCSGSCTSASLPTGRQPARSRPPHRDRSPRTGVGEPSRRVADDHDRLGDICRRQQSVEVLDHAFRGRGLLDRIAAARTLAHRGTGAVVGAHPGLLRDEREHGRRVDAICHDRPVVGDPR